MKCIVTAGPTFEELDEVRRLTNFSTGTLGTELANFLVEKGHDVELLRGQLSTCRLEPKARRVQEFTTTDDLRQRLKAIGRGGAGAVFHAAAVSDFAFAKIFERKPDGVLKQIHARKIPTQVDRILVELKATPKIISELRAWFPIAVLVGWKYEVETSERAQIIMRACRQMADNQTDACVLNGRAYGEGFGLVAAQKQVRHFADRQPLFEALEKLL
jgi:phosphopantothenoylcysteine synthetase/decarboxylase